MVLPSIGLVHLHISFLIIELIQNEQAMMAIAEEIQYFLFSPAYPPFKPLWAYQCEELPPC